VHSVETLLCAVAEHNTGTDLHKDLRHIAAHFCHCCYAQALHARALALKHPLTGSPLKFVAPLHDDFQAALQMLGLAVPEGV
jgi:hypothetical protein